MTALRFCLPGLCSQASGIIFAPVTALTGLCSQASETALRFRLPGLCSQASGLIFASVTALRLRRSGIYAPFSLLASALWALSARRDTKLAKPPSHNRMHRFCGLQCPVHVSSRLLSTFPASSWRPRLNCGVRFGEASNPGPGQALLTSYFGNKPSPSPPSAPPKEDACVISVVNPTSVLHKAPLFSELGADDIVMSETSAVLRAQEVTGAAMRQQGYRMHWGTAVASHSHSDAGGPTLRGLAAGVALASRLPSRASRPALTKEVTDTCRIAEAFVRFGPVEVRIITMYGYQAALLDAKEHNEALLRAAFDRASQNTIPCIVAGDFNMKPFDFPAGQLFSQMGYQEVFQLHSHKTGVLLPPTCKGSTRHDTALIHPSLLPLWDGAWVLSDRQLFDAHDPLCFRLRLPTTRPCRAVWRLPRPWTALGVSANQLAAELQPQCADLVARATKCDSTASIDAALQEFASVIETAVDTVLRQQHRADPVRSPHAYLAKCYRGRCQPRRLVKREVPCLARPDREGGYTPDVEVTSVLGRLRVRQVRRLLTLCKGLQKFSSQALLLPLDQQRQFQKEWGAICRASGYTPSFPQWVLQVACFHDFPDALPDLDWLRDVTQYVRFDCDALVRKQAKARIDNFRYQVHLDQTEGHSRQGYAAMKPPPKPPFTEVPVVAECEVKALAPELEGCREYCVPEGHSFREGAVAQLAEEVCTVRAAEPLRVVLQGPQTVVACTADELHDAFADYWGPIWQRDVGPASDDLDQWPRFRDLLAGLAPQLPQLQLRSFAPDLWRAAIGRMSSRKATGVCGWSPADLKLLPDCALEVLNAIFHQAVTCGLPEHLLQTRVGVLAKVQQPTGMHQSRPIIVFSCLYRVWSSVLARQILQQWAPHFPCAISGSMPQRSCRDVSYRQQWHIEASLLTSSPCLGLSVDIIKCFNQIGWAPAGAILRHLGVPAAEVSFWLSCLRRHTRCTAFHGSLSHGLVCANGAPEGDPMSVVAMAGVCYIAFLACSHNQVEFESYVDNWAWRSSSRQALAGVVPRALSFLDCLALPVDYKKSYVWSTQRSDRVWWKTEAAALFPPGCLPKLVTEVHDLGVAFKYDRHGHRQSRNHRLQAGLDRLDRLRRQPRAVLNKARLVQTGVWPQCLYGAEGHSHSLSEFSQLRGTAARAIVGQHQVMSPHLALVALADVVQDPFVYCLERQLTAFRRACLHDPDTAMEVLQVASSPGVPKRAHGPATALCISLVRLGLTLTSDTWLKGLDNTRVRLDTCQVSDIKALLQRSWALYVQNQVSHRNGLLQAPPVYSTPVVRLLGKFTGPEQAVLMRHVSGAFSSAAAKQRWAQDADGCCALCGRRQTKWHKFTACPALEHARVPWQPHLELILGRWPFWVHCPVTTLPEDVEVPQLIFHTRRLTPPQVDFTAWPRLAARGCIRMYTDGSCRHPGTSLAHHAGFAVVLDTTSADSEVLDCLDQWRQTAALPSGFAVIAQGLVPGHQTINRAELCGVLQALQAAHSGGFRKIEIWVDSQYVLQMWNRASVVPGDANYDLCHQILYWKSEWVQLRKVESHQDLDKLTGLAQWHAAGNHVADHAAKAAVRADLSVVTDIQDNAARHIREQADLLGVFWRYLLALSAEEHRLLKATLGPPPQTPPPDVLPDDTAPGMPRGLDSWLRLNDGIFQATTLPPAPRAVLLACSWPPWFTVPLWRWLQDLRWQQPSARERAPPGITYLELLLDFVVTTGLVPPESLEQAVRVSEPQLSWPRPVTTRTFTHVLVEAVRQLERLSRLNIWGPKRNKVFSLRHFRVSVARHGLPCRPRLRQPRVVGELLHATLLEGSVLPLQQYVRRYTGPWHHDSAIQHDWLTLTAANRAALAKDLRRRRGP